MTLNRLDSDPYAEGADARLAGKNESANPYEIATDAHLSWNDGWASIDEDDDDIEF